MKWIGQHIVDLVSRFRNTVYFEGDVEFNTDTVTFQSANADDPIVTIKNTSNAANDMASLNFVKDRDGGTAAINDNLAEIYFSGEDASGNAQEYGRILCEIDVATHGQESGRLKFGVANHDGGNGYGLLLTGGSVSNEVDVNIGLGTGSVTTLAGTLTMGSTYAMDNSGLLRVANQSNITGLGTIGTGVWEGTAIASDQQKHLMHYQLAGYGQGDGTNYEVTQNINDTNAPFEHNTSVGSDGTTAITVANMSRTGGHVMPRACTLKRWTGWGTCAGSQTVYIGLFKASFTRDDSTNVSLVLLDEFSYTAMGNNKMEDFDETSFTATAIAAGDMIITAIKSQSGYTQYFNSTVEVEF